MIFSQLYERVFEKEMLKETGEYYRREAADLMAENACSVYIQKVTNIVSKAIELFPCPNKHVHVQIFQYP